MRINKRRIRAGWQRSFLKELRRQIKELKKNIAKDFLEDQVNQGNP